MTEEQAKAVAKLIMAVLDYWRYPAAAPPHTNAGDGIVQALMEIKGLP